MPTYEYECPQGHRFELFQKMSDPPRAACPECGEEARRLLSPGAGLLFKGEGFYITDYRSDSYRKKAEAERKGGGESGGKAGSDKGSSGKEKSAGGSSSEGSSSSSSSSG